MSKMTPFLDSASIAVARAAAASVAPTSRTQGVWTEAEHDRFLAAMKLYPTGPWKDIAIHVGTRSVRQVQTHAQKYHEKVERRMRGLRKERKRLLRPEHRVDDDARVLGSGGMALRTLSSLSLASTNSAEAGAGASNDCRVSCSSDSDVCKSEATGATSDDGDSDRGLLLDDFDEHCLDYLLSVLADADCSDSGSLESSSDNSFSSAS